MVPSSCLLELVGIGAALYPQPLAPNWPSISVFVNAISRAVHAEGLGPRSDSQPSFLPSSRQTVEALSACQTASAERAQGAKNGIFLSLKAFM